MGDALMRIKVKGELEFLADPTETSLKRAFRRGGFQRRGNAESSRLTGMPGWCAVHVVPVIVDQHEPWDMILLWEPFSRVMLGTIVKPLGGQHEFEGDELNDFILNSFKKKLPRQVTQKVTELRFTNPEANPRHPHWYTSKSRASIIELAKARNKLKYLKRVTILDISNNEVSAMHDPVDLRAHLDGIQTGRCAKIQLQRALDAHNLTSSGEMDEIFAKIDSWPPQQRLIWSMRTHSDKKDREALKIAVNQDSANYTNVTSNTLTNIAQINQHDVRNNLAYRAKYTILRK